MTLQVCSKGKIHICFPWCQVGFNLERIIQHLHIVIQSMGGPPQHSRSPTKPYILYPWAPVWSTSGAHVDQMGAHGHKMQGPATNATSNPHNFCTWYSRDKLFTSCNFLDIDKIKHVLQQIIFYKLCSSFLCRSRCIDHSVGLM